MAVTDMTVRHYVDVLANTFMVRVLAPWHENISKRQVKAPRSTFVTPGFSTHYSTFRPSGTSTAIRRSAHPGRGS